MQIFKFARLHEHKRGVLIAPNRSRCARAAIITPFPLRNASANNKGNNTKRLHIIYIMMRCIFITLVL